ncbi:MAG: blaR [Planctomycetaceae bacterium]|nr:blaR [Planctomycetaceae bacterium]
MIKLDYESVNACAARWASTTWAVSSQFCVLGLAIFLIHLSLRQAAPNWRYWLWQLLAVKLLLMPYWTAAVPWSSPVRAIATAESVVPVEVPQVERKLAIKSSEPAKVVGPERPIPMLRFSNVETRTVARQSSPKSEPASSKTATDTKTTPLTRGTVPKRSENEVKRQSQSDPSPGTSYVSPLAKGTPKTSLAGSATRVFDTPQNTVGGEILETLSTTSSLSLVNDSNIVGSDAAGVDLTEATSTTDLKSSESSARVTETASEPVSPAGLSWKAWLMLAWMAGVSWYSFRILWQGISLNRRLRTASPAEIALVHRVRDATVRLGMRRCPEVRVLDDNISPFVYGLWSPKLILPLELSESFSPEQLELVLLHELAHVRRRDLIWGWIPEFCRILFFFHPLVHAMCYQIRFERELACDQLAIVTSGRDAATYAETLVTVIGQCFKSDIVTSEATRK